jgi:hypothetical protein
MLVFRYDTEAVGSEPGARAAGSSDQRVLRVVGRCDGPGVAPKWQGNTALWVIPTPEPAFFKIKNDVKRPAIDSMPFAAVVLEPRDDANLLPGWMPYADQP